MAVQKTTRFVAWSLGIFWLCCGSASAQTESKISFAKDIRPILNHHCVGCHGGVKQAADVSFIYREQVVAPDGWVVEPTRPDDSLLMDRVTTGDEETRMPPPEHGRALNAEEVAKLRRWIEEGAPWEGHWAFVPPARPVKAREKPGDWARSQIDVFVLSRMKQNGLEPAVEAKPERWLRRVSLDLTGLPPSLEMRNLFLSSLAAASDSREREAVFEKVVERLLNSPSFGERWASVWLDQVRYADSKGLGADGRRNVWKYRDWVIRAFNDDMPFDQFTIKQMAGDLLPRSTVGDLVATAAHRCTQTNEEGGTDDEEFRVAAVLDRVNTTWQAWQGLTFGCTQCHSHPYEPFRHEDYYRFAAFFNNTTDSDLGQDWPVVKVPLSHEDDERASAIGTQIRKQQREIWEMEFPLVSNVENWQPLDLASARTNNQTRVELEERNGTKEFRTRGTVSRGTDIVLTAPVPKDVNIIQAIRLDVLPLQPESAVADSEWGFSLSHITGRLVSPDGGESQPLELNHVIADEPFPFYDPQESLNPKSGQGFAAYTRIFQRRSAAFVLKSPLQVPQGSSVEIVLKHRVFILAAFPLVSRRGALFVSDSEDWNEFRHSDDLENRRAALRDLKKLRDQIPSTTVPVLRERESHLSRQQYVFERGVFLDKGERVTPGTPGSLHEFPDQVPVNRLGLAKWLVHEKNPLTARVAVNRLWARLMGKGLVETEEDFGSSGQPPTHPDLLDYLAIRFQFDLGWSHKAMLREIVLSATYRQASIVTGPGLEKDPGNRWLARGPRNRLDAELLRDQALAISGLLSSKMYGPPVHPPIPEGVWRPFQGGDKWNTPPVDSENRYRRSIYTYTKRSIPYPMFAAFDAPSRETCTPRRLPSNTPLQSLMLLNDQTMRECADALGQRIAQWDGSLAEKLAAGFVLATGRDASPEELKDLVDLASKFEGDRPWTAVGTVLLNLDEVQTK